MPSPAPAPYESRPVAVPLTSFMTPPCLLMRAQLRRERGQAQSRYPRSQRDSPLQQRSNFGPGRGVNSFLGGGAAKRLRCSPARPIEKRDGPKKTVRLPFLHLAGLKSSSPACLISTSPTRGPLLSVVAPDRRMLLRL